MNNPHLSSASPGQVGGYIRLSWKDPNTAVRTRPLDTMAFVIGNPRPEGEMKQPIRDRVSCQETMYDSGRSRERFRWGGDSGRVRGGQKHPGEGRDQGLREGLPAALGTRS